MENEELKRKREELKRRLFEHKQEQLHTSAAPISIPYGRDPCGRGQFFDILFPSEIEMFKGEGTLYGYRANIYGDRMNDGLYFHITSNKPSSECEEIGKIFKERPEQYLSEGITGFYENGELQFINYYGNQCKKVPYPLFESWLNGKIDIKYNL